VALLQEKVTALRHWVQEQNTALMLTQEKNYTQKTCENLLEKLWKTFLSLVFVRIQITTLRHWSKTSQRCSVVDLSTVKMCERRTWKLVDAHLLHPVLFCFALSIPTIDDATVVVTSVADDITHLKLDRHCLVGPPYLPADRFIVPLELELLLTWRVVINHKRDVEALQTRGLRSDKYHWALTPMAHLQVY